MRVVASTSRVWSTDFYVLACASSTSRGKAEATLKAYDMNSISSKVRGQREPMLVTTNGISTQTSRSSSTSGILVSSRYPAMLFLAW